MSSNQTSDEIQTIGENNDQKEEPKEQTKDQSKSAELKKRATKGPESGISKAKSGTAPESSPTPSAAPSLQTIESIPDSEQSVVTLESLKYLQILDQYVSGKHWDLNVEYNLNAISAILWSLVIHFFLFYEITGNCWTHLMPVFVISLAVSTITAFEVTIVSVVWYLSLLYSYINRSKICLSVITCFFFTAFLNLLVAVILFGTNTCYHSGKLDPSVEHIVPVKYEVKTTAIIHLIVSINLFMCAVLLAIKRNDFKFYVLWRKGLLNDYLLLEHE